MGEVERVGCWVEKKKSEREREKDINKIEIKTFTIFKRLLYMTDDMTFYNLFSLLFRKRKREREREVLSLRASGTCSGVNVAR